MAALFLFYLTSKGAFFLSLLCTISHSPRCTLMATRLCFLFALFSAMNFFNRVFFHSFLGVFFMDLASYFNIFFANYNGFGCGFLIFGCFSRVFNVFVLFFLFLLGFLVFQYSGCCKVRGKSMKGFSFLCCSCNNVDEIDGLKVKSFEGGTTKMLRDLGENVCGDQKFEEINETGSLNCGFCNDVGNNGGECEEFKEFCDENQLCPAEYEMHATLPLSFNDNKTVSGRHLGPSDEDQVFDVITLRKMVKDQRKRANVAQNELEKERMAATSSVDEAMAMILRLQNEKSVLQMQVNQLERVYEEKQLHDQEVIQSLQWIVMKHESERSILEDQLRMCREKLKTFMKGEEWDQFDSVCPTPSVSHQPSFESRVDGLFVGSLDFDSPPM